MMIVVLILFGLFTDEISAVNNGVALTPPMGWNSWNFFACSTNCTADPDGCISEKLFMGMADAMVSSGLSTLGYEYINLDDCWLATTRDADGNLQPDPERFPSGIGALADYIHSKGLKFGIYEDVGTNTCEGYPGCEGNEVRDSIQFSNWGVDYVKLDGCNFDVNQMKEKYTQWSILLNETARTMVFSCSWPAYADLDNVNISFEYVASICNLWREWDDIKPYWSKILNILDYQESKQLAQYAGTGHWNDPDMLEVGSTLLTYDEQVSHFSLWAILAAPLIIGTDLRSMTQQTLTILSNKEVIQVNQDTLGIQGTRVYSNSNGGELWYRSLVNGDRAVVLFNRGSQANITVSVTWSQIGLTASQSYRVRDLWQHKTLGYFSNGFSFSIGVHASRTFRVYAK